MKWDDAMWLELGLGVLLVSIVAGIIAVIQGGATESLRAQSRRSEPTPGRGSVPTERHLNVSANPAR